MASIGSVFVALGQTFFYCCISRISSQWFGDTQRALSTGLGGVSIPFGSILGFILPVYLVSEKDL